jgi:Cd(II)/Pb(II)-responsive transcriptional regulator
MKIGELALATQTPAETIRYYEREGLLPRAARADNNYRTYGPEHQQRLAFIRHCRGLDMSLDEIRALLDVWDDPRKNCDAVNELLDAHLGHVVKRIRELRALKRQLEALRTRCNGGQTGSRCGILHELGQALDADGVADRKYKDSCTARLHPRQTTQ